MEGSLSLCRVKGYFQVIDVAVFLRVTIMSLLPGCDNVVLANILLIIYWDEIFFFLAWSSAYDPFNTLLKGRSSLEAYLFFALKLRTLTKTCPHKSATFLLELELEYRP